MAIRYSDPKRLQGKSGYFSRTRDTLTDRRSWASCGTDNLRVAREWVTTRRMEEAMGPDRVRAAKAGDMIFRDAIAQWLAEKRLKVGERRMVDLEARTKAFWLPFFGNMACGAITREVVADYFRKRKLGTVAKSKRLGKGAPKGRLRLPSARTLNNDITDLKTFFRAARRAAWVHEDPTDGMERFSGEMRRRVRSLTQEEEARLLAACRAAGEIVLTAKRNAGGVEGGRSTEGKSTWTQAVPVPGYLYPAVLTALRCGFRRRTLLSLEWRHVDFDRAQWTIPARLLKVAEDYHAPVLRVVVEELRAYRARLLAEDGPGRVAPSALIFGLKERSSIRGSFRSAAKRAGLPLLSLHDLRRCFINNLRRAGVGIEVTMKLSAHRSLQTLIAHYREVGEPELRQAVDAMERTHPAQDSPGSAG